jgi:hypothetical protein
MRIARTKFPDHGIGAATIRHLIHYIAHSHQLKLFWKLSKASKVTRHDLISENVTPYNVSLLFWLGCLGIFMHSLSTTSLPQLTANDDHHLSDNQQRLKIQPCGLVPFLWVALASRLCPFLRGS